ncbi:MAG TPA: hypothetical protein VF530_18730 [Planctomycetota bacterium]
MDSKLRLRWIGGSALLACAVACSDSGGGGGGAATATLSGTILGSQGLPLPGAVVEVSSTTLLLGGSGTTTRSAVTDDFGNFILLDNPTGSVHVHVDGSGVAGGTFASIELALVLGAGASILPQPVVLPDLSAGSTELVVVDGNGMTVGDSTLGDPQTTFYSLEIPTGTTITVDGIIPASGLVTVNVTSVPAREVPMPLPAGLQGTAFVTIQPPGAAFNPPLSLTLPNTENLALGTQVDIWSFDHGIGGWVNRSEQTGNRGVVMDVGGTELVVASNVITEGGWHSAVIDVEPLCATTLAGQVFAEGSNAVPVPNVLISLQTGQFGVTDAAGRFSIPSVPAYNAAVLPQCELFDNVFLTALGPVSHGANRTSTMVPTGILVLGGVTNVPPFDLTVSVTGSLVGSVEDASGNPADGTVTLAGPQNRTVQTSGAAFFASNLTPGAYTASFEFASKLTGTADITVTANQQAVVRVVEPGAPPGDDTIVVHVVDLTQAGVASKVPQASVTLVGASGAPLFRTANGAGIAEFEDAPAGPYTVTAQIESPLLPAGSFRVATTVVGVNALGNPPTIVLPFLDTGASPPAITTDAMLDGTVQNVPASTVLEYQIADRVLGFFDSGPADTGFSASIPSGLALDVGVVAIDTTTQKIVSGIFVANVLATPGQTLMLDFDFANAHPFDRPIDMTYSNVQMHPSKSVELALGGLAYALQPGVDFPDPLCMPNLARAKFADFPAVLAFGSEDLGPAFAESSCDQPLLGSTPLSLSVPFIGPPTINEPADGASFPSYGAGKVVDLDLGTAAGVGPGFNGISFFHESQSGDLLSLWNILVSPQTLAVTLPPVFPSKPMFTPGFAGVNVDTTRFVFPGFSFAGFFDANLPANLAAVLEDRICGASRSHFFTIGVPFQAAPPRELVRRVLAARGARP